MVTRSTLFPRPARTSRRDSREAMPLHTSVRRKLLLPSHLPPKIFLPLNILGALVWALIFTTLGYAGGEVVAPWLHHLDQHLKHWIWLILAVVLVISVRWWLKRRSRKQVG